MKHFPMGYESGEGGVIPMGYESERVAGIDHAAGHGDPHERRTITDPGAVAGLFGWHHGGGVAGLARSLDSGSGGPAGSVGSGARSSGPTGAWTVDSAGTARPTPSGGSAPGGRGPDRYRTCAEHPLRGPRRPCGGHGFGVASGGGWPTGAGRLRPGTGSGRPECSLRRHRCRWLGFMEPPTSAAGAGSRRRRDGRDRRSARGCAKCRR